jgi:radical SAM-linked protein
VDKLRLRFEKTGRAVYISHLDLMAVMQRAFARADLPLKFSEGFNPHPQISILLPLSVGTASICELMDFRLLEERDLKTLPDRLTAVLPDGIRALEAYESVRKSAQLKWLDIEGMLEYDTVKPMADKLDAFFSRPELTIEKKTKRGSGQADIRPAIDKIGFSDTGEGLKLRARISAQEPTLNPDHLINALRQLCPELAPDFARFTRLETYDADGNVYR